MGWDYTARLVYGILVEDDSIPEDTECRLDFIDKLCEKHGIDYAVFSFYGSEEQCVIHDKGMSLGEGYTANAVELPAVKGPSENLLAVAQKLNLKSAAKWYLGICVW